MLLKTKEIIKSDSSVVSTDVSTMSSELAKLRFLRYVKTKQFMTLKYRGNDTPKAVHISQRYIEKHFFIYPAHNRKECLRELINDGQLKIQKTEYFTYECLADVELDFSMITKKDNFVSVVLESLREDLKNVSLISGADSTDYFNTFLMHKDKCVNLFFNVDNFAGRIHTPVTNLHREYRDNLLLYNEKTISFDVVTMQPVLLGKILFQYIGHNEYTDWINDGLDIYVMLQEKASLKTRDEAKKRFFEILFAPASDSLAQMFGSSAWINWINGYKKLVIPENPHNYIKRYSNLAWMLQSTEVKIMYQVWNLLYRHRIPLLTIHDEIRVRVKDKHIAESIFMQVLENEFQYFKLNAK